LTKADKATLAAALIAAGWTVEETAEGLTARNRAERASMTWRKGQTANIETGTYSDVTAASIARLYSRQVVLTSAARAGWRVKETAPGVFIAQR